MAKKKSWFGWVVKKLFTCNDKAKRAKEWKWNLRRFEVRQYPALMTSRRTLCEAAEEQKKHALNVAIATAAAAKAAVAAAEAAVEVVRLTGTPGSCKYFRKLDPNSAAIKIQSAYRAHLARKALRALKGVVRLQAIVRGRAVRRQTTPTLKRLRSNSRRQSEVRERVIHARDEWSKGGEKKTLFRPRKEVQDTEQKLEVGSQGEWDCSVLSKEDIESVWLKRQEATIKRERMKKYSFSHRERMNDTFAPQDLSSKKEHGARSCRVVESSGEGRETSKPSTRSNISNNTTHGNSQAKQKSTRHPTKESLEGMSTELPLLRNSFSHEKWDPFGDAVLIPSSPAFFPTYMAATESAKAKTRSMSIPKQRVGFWDGCLEGNYRHKNRLSLWSSYDGESLWRN